MFCCCCCYREPQGILACCTPVPPLLRANLSDVHSCVLEAVKVEFVLNVSLPKTYSLYSTCVPTTLHVYLCRYVHKYIGIGMTCTLGGGGGGLIQFHVQFMCSIIT